MKLYPTSTDPTGDAQLVCRNARLGLLILLAIFWAAAVLWWWLDAPRLIYYLCAGIAMFITPFVLGSWRKRGRPENWVLALHRDGLWVNLRDCEYYLAEPGDTVLFVPYEEIISAKKSIHRYTAPSGNGSRQHKDVYLDLQINSPETELLRAALKADRKRSSPPRKYLGGLVTVSDGGIKRQPTELVRDDLLRIKFTSHNVGLRPRLKRVLSTLAYHVSVEQEQQQAETDWQTLDDTGFHQLVQKMVRDGKDFQAISVLRQRSDMSTTAARDFVREIRRQLAE